MASEYETQFVPPVPTETGSVPRRSAKANMDAAVSVQALRRKTGHTESIPTPLVHFNGEYVPFEPIKVEPEVIDEFGSVRMPDGQIILGHGFDAVPSSPATGGPLVIRHTQTVTNEVEVSDPSQLGYYGVQALADSFSRSHGNTSGQIAPPSQVPQQIEASHWGEEQDFIEEYEPEIPTDFTGQEQVYDAPMTTYDEAETGSHAGVAGFMQDASARQQAQARHPHTANAPKFKSVMGKESPAWIRVTAALGIAASGFFIFPRAASVGSDYVQQHGSFEPVGIVKAVMNPVNLIRGGL